MSLITSYMVPLCSFHHDPLRCDESTASNCSSFYYSLLRLKMIFETTKARKEN